MFLDTSTVAAHGAAVDGRSMDVLLLHEERRSSGAPTLLVEKEDADQASVPAFHHKQFSVGERTMVSNNTSDVMESASSSALEMVWRDMESKDGVEVWGDMDRWRRLASTKRIESKLEDGVREGVWELSGSFVFT